MSQTTAIQQNTPPAASAAPDVAEAARELAAELRALPLSPAPDAVRRRVFARLDAQRPRPAGGRRWLWAGAAAGVVVALAAALWPLGFAPAPNRPAAAVARGAAAPTEPNVWRLAAPVESAPARYENSLAHLRARAHRVEAERRATAIVFPPSRAETVLIAGIRELDALAAQLGRDANGRVAAEALLRHTVELTEGLAELERSRQAALMQEASL